MNALMYHDVVAAGAEDSSGFPGRDAALYKVTPEQFGAHLDAILRCVAIVPGPAASVPVPDPLPVSHVAPSFAAVPFAITFDDGGASAMRAAEMLESRGLTGCFFITTDYIGTRGFVTSADVRELASRGHIVGSHSCSHPLRMAHCAWGQLVDEWTRSCRILADIVGAQIQTASVPGGDFAPHVAKAAARAGITTLFTSEPTNQSYDAHGVALQGRFTIQKWTTAGAAASLAAGEWLPCARQAVVWNAKKLTKRVGGERYLRLRKLLLRHGDEVRWGDRVKS
jgi:peptidoglycan/xylan/chitin deacetylase (PgdA/CDA1 family)